jgi:hypothetical protein
MITRELKDKLDRQDQKVQLEIKENVEMPDLLAKKVLPDRKENLVVMDFQAFPAILDNLDHRVWLADLSSSK